MLYHFFLYPVFSHLRDNAEVQMENCKNTFYHLSSFGWQLTLQKKKRKSHLLVLFVSG